MPDDASASLYRLKHSAVEKSAHVIGKKGLDIA